MELKALPPSVARTVLVLLSPRVVLRPVPSVPVARTEMLLPWPESLITVVLGSPTLVESLPRPAQIWLLCIAESTCTEAAPEPPMLHATEDPVGVSWLSAAAAPSAYAVA
jgi:hypothetical protein